MALSAWQATIVNEFGDVIPSASVQVIDKDTGLASDIYSTAGGASLGNPFLADTNGFAQFYTNAGTYRIIASDAGSGFSETWEDQRLGDTQARDTGTSDGEVPTADLIGDVEITATGTTTPRSLADRFGDVVSLLDCAGDGSWVSRLAEAESIGKPVSFKGVTSISLSTPYKMKVPAVDIPQNIPLTDLTSGGLLDFNAGFLQGSGLGTRNRFPDRVYVGEAASKWAGTTLPDTGGSWLNSASEGPAYILSNAQFLSMTSENQPAYATVGAAKVFGGSSRSAMALAGAAVNQGDGGARGLMIEAQHETTNATTWGIEVAIKNASGGGGLISPYGSLTNMTFGMQINGGSDAAFGPTATDPVTAGIIINSKVKGSPYGFYTGIQFRDGTIVGSEPEAISAPHGYAFKWYEDTNRAPAAVIKSTNNTPNSKVTLDLPSSGMTLFNNQGSAAFQVVTNPTDSNRVQVFSSALGNSPSVRATGPDVAVDLAFITKGAGKVKFGDHSTLSGEAISGYITIKDSTGAERKLAVIS